jgi:hypothetical protein
VICSCYHIGLLTTISQPIVDGCAFRLLTPFIPLRGGKGESERREQGGANEAQLFIRISLTEHDPVLRTANGSGSYCGGIGWLRWL